MRIYKLLFLYMVLFSSCDAGLQSLNPPIILVAKDSGGSVILTDGSLTITLSSDYTAARAIAESYNPGDTLFYLTKK